jgi:hypothetical protein
VLKIFNPPGVALFKLKNPFSEFFADFFRPIQDVEHLRIFAVQVLYLSPGHRVAAFARSPTAESIESYADRNSSADFGDRPPAAVSTRITISNRSPASDTLSMMSYT